MIEREKLQHLIENIGIPKLCLILLLGISLIIVSIPSGKTKKNAQSTETTAKEDSTDLYVKKQERRLVNALKHVEGVGKVKVMITVNSSKEAVVNKDSPYEQSSSEKEKIMTIDHCQNEGYIVGRFAGGICGNFFVQDIGNTGKGSGIISNCVTLLAPRRMEVPTQSLPVSPPPMTTTCFPFGLIYFLSSRLESNKLLVTDVR